MNKTLSHFQGYSLFMEYLLEELSIENMLFVTEIVHLKHLFHKLQRKKKKLENKGKKMARARLRVSMPSRRKSTHSTKRQDSEEIKYDDDVEVGATGSTESVQSTQKNLRFTLSVTPSDYETDLESADEFESPSHQSRARNGTNNSDNVGGEDESPSFFDTSSTKTMPMNTARSRDAETHKKNDWKTIKKKYVLNPQDENLPFISKSIYKSPIMKENDFYTKIKMIFQRYIVASALYEINIKYNQRKRLLLRYNEKYKNYKSQQNQLFPDPKEPKTPSSPDISHDESTGSQLATVSETRLDKNDSGHSTHSGQRKLNDEEYILLNKSVTIEDIEIFDKAAQSIMGLLRSSYIEFCKTKEYEAFASAYRGSGKLDIFTALRGETMPACRCVCCL